MNPEPSVVVIKARNFTCSEVQLENLALEFMGARIQAIGGQDDIHFEFPDPSLAAGFRKALKPFLI